MVRPMPWVLLRCSFFTASILRFVIYCSCFQGFCWLASHCCYWYRVLCAWCSMLISQVDDGNGEINARLFSFNARVCAHHVTVRRTRRSSVLRLPNIVYITLWTHIWLCWGLNVVMFVRVSSRRTCVRVPCVCVCAWPCKKYLILVWRKLMEFHFTLH